LAIAFEVEDIWSQRLKLSRSRRLKKSKIEEVKDWRSRRLKKSKFSSSWSLMKLKIEEVKRLMKSKIEEVEDWKKSKIEVLRLNPSLQLELSLGGYWHGYALQVPTD
jgi:hypothetical protein